MISNANHFQDLPKKQQQVLTAAVELFSKYGVRRVTVQEICNSADISKMTFYKYYPNKWDLAKSILDFLAATEFDFYYFIVDGDAPFAQKVEEILTLALSRIYGIGLGADFFDDVSHVDSPVYAHYRAQQQKSRTLVEEFFEKGQNDGHLAKDIEMPFLLLVFRRLSEFVNDPEFIETKPDIAERIQAVSALFFYGFSKG
ncbi:MAG: TetR/AcrR family transcriptional regulator [Proteobacteria bacterium]|nr:TetR/AcrR family transcriptional regulator [Pseudomonadota bacterium]